MAPSFSDKGFRDDAEIERLFQDSLGWYGPAEITFRGCELRIYRHTGTTCHILEHREPEKWVFNFSEFDSYLLPDTSSETVGIFLDFGNETKHDLQRARRILEREYRNLPAELNVTSQFMEEHVASGVKTEACYGYVQFLPHWADSISLFVDITAARSILRVISTKIQSCKRPSEVDRK